MTVAGLGVVVVGCGLEGRPGAMGPEPAASTSTPDMVIRPGEAAPASSEADGSTRSTVSGMPTMDWVHLPIGPSVNAWLPSSPDWEMTEQGVNQAGHSYLVMTNERAGVRVQLQSITAEPGLTAAGLCAQALQATLDQTGSDSEPSPVGNPVPQADLVDAFSCAANGVSSPDGSLDYRLDTVIRATDGTVYLQLLRVQPGGQDQARTAALGTVDEMLRRTVDELNQR